MKEVSRLGGMAVAGVLAVVLSPLLLGIWIFHLISGFVLAVAWWRKHGRDGRRFLVVYSNSPKWATFFSENVVPSVLDQAVVIDISANPSWKSARSVERRAHLHWGGKVEHTPVVIHFPSVWRAETVRFYEAFMQQQRGDSSQLEKQLAKVRALASSMVGA